MRLKLVSIMLRIIILCLPIQNPLELTTVGKFFKYANSAEPRQVDPTQCWDEFKDVDMLLTDCRSD